MTIQRSERNDLTFLLDGLVHRVPHVLFAFVLASDGLVIQKSTALPADAADSIAAGSGSLYGVAKGMGGFFDSGRVQHVVIEYSKRTLFVAEAGANARLAVVCEPEVDMGTVAYEMSRLVTRIGEFLSAEARSVASIGQSGAIHDR